MKASPDRFRTGWMIRLPSFARILFVAAPLAAAAEPSSPAPLQRIAFGSCANQNLAQPIWDPVVAAKPDLFLFVGDNIYADTEDMELMKAKYAKLEAQPGYRKLKQTCPVLATWDDHDYGVNDGGAWYPKREESAKIMLDFFGVPADSPRRGHAGIYGAHTFGPAGKRVQVILLDTRSFKSRPIKDPRGKEELKKLNLVGWYVPNPDPATTLLGPAQWEWLEQQLREPADLRIIASSIQVIADEKGMESWGNFPHERKRLYGLIARTRAAGVVMISGDVHFSEVSRTADGPYPLTDFTSSGLTHSSAGWAAAVNRHRVGPRAYAEPTFGLIEIDWEAPSPVVSLQARDLKGRPALEVTLRLGELRIPGG
jgi:alkaline phosphatase D